jgi:hypothetical protein
LGPDLPDVQMWRGLHMVETDALACRRDDDPEDLLSDHRLWR